MSNPQRRVISRRTFVRNTGLTAGGLLAVGGSLPAAEPAPTAVAAEPIPTRMLGRTNVPIATFTLGTAPMGISPTIPPKEIAGIIDFAIDVGVTSIDTAPMYQQAEEGIGLALGRRRKDVFLATKVFANTVAEAEKSLATSFELLKTDYFDLVYYHSIGSRNLEGTMEPGGVYDWLVKQKKAGKYRFLGISGHQKPGRFPQFLETGEVDVLLTVVNFVDRHTYNFEDRVLPVARKHNVGIVAMKVFGGARKKAGGYANSNAPPELDVAHLESAVRYALGTPGVATLNLGAHKKEQIRQNVDMVRRFKPLDPAEQDELASLGKKLAATWGPHFGPIEDEDAKA